MSYNHSSKIQNLFSSQRTIKQICTGCFDNKRYQFLFILCLFTIPMIVLYSNIPVQPQISTQSSDVCSTLLDILYNSNRTLCSEEADRRGNKQKIISLSIFGPQENQLFIDEKFSSFIIPLLHEAKTLFPSWTIRLYTDESSMTRLNLKNLSHIASNIDICNVNQLPVLGNVEEYLPGKLWRFLPVLDSMVDFVSSRDLDSPLIEREQVVVEQFINSSFIFLSLRDHPQHGVPILGGMWTCAICRNRLLFLRLFSILIDKNQAVKYSLTHDQTLLNELIWPRVKDETLVFDSYTCEKFKDGQQRPFPIQRQFRDCHIGCVRPCCQNSSHIALPTKCPKACRPIDHPDWLYC